MADFTAQLKNLGACGEAIKWVNGRSLRKCWQVSNRADHMLWLAHELGIDRKLLVLAACDCAETAQKYADDGSASANTLKVARDWCEDRASIKEVREAVEAAEAAADAAHYSYGPPYYAAHAAFLAADLADDDYDADYDAHAIEAAEAAADAAYYSVYDDADPAADAPYVSAETAQKKMAALVRKRIPVEVIEEALQEKSDA